MAASPFATHEVFNQPPPLGDMDLWGDDLALQGAVKAFRHDDNQLTASLAAFGERWGTAEMAEFGRLANEIRRSSGPTIRTAIASTASSSIRLTTR